MSILAVVATVLFGVAAVLYFINKNVAAGLVAAGLAVLGVIIGF